MAEAPFDDLVICPMCGGAKYSQDADLLKRDRVRCEGCKLEFRRRDMTRPTS